MQVDEPQRDALADYEEQILQWLQPDETAGQLLRRTYVQPLRTGLPLIDRFTTLRGGQVGGEACFGGAEARHGTAHAVWTSKQRAP